jgi:SAM-dependent methyltransferase
MSYSNKFYSNGDYTFNNPDFNDGESAKKASCFLNFLAKNNFLNFRFKTILDIGCGSGGFIKELNKMCGHLEFSHGIDLNPDAIEYANNTNNNKNIIFENKTINDISESYDLVSMVHVFEHIHDLKNFMHDIKLKGNIFYINLPLEASVWMCIRKNVLVNQYNKYGHINFFNEKLVLKILEDFGFEILATDYSDEFTSFNSFSSKIIKYPRLFIGLFSKKIACNFLGGYCFQILLKCK